MKVSQNLSHSEVASPPFKPCTCTGFAWAVCDMRHNDNGATVVGRGGGGGGGGGWWGWGGV